ncbi:hypothetical protein [Lentilactobacillus hilgardii]|uniref:Uncharacterized protein n=1 Tax=Lentilactobacillus hilgardii (strain ATCC 8290 / DSM 20176 / CCUG 30140 / JCM 1155 / KCTC 3500 / NBRC 15886 / NCIMB 8040 / NRRL B-1843 / 9) TaxID=1423757 RepID=C0XKE8_LENH9|nr:hypothetical protein [Lentilactobacillus hilgardii]EEI24140.1 hypothetical protein HMPREF0519_1709 [Lentilactobacillus hilgardii DSM 20176 = ATCC 8290]
MFFVSITMTARLVLSNGRFVTANRNLVIVGSTGLQKMIRAN